MNGLAKQALLKQLWSFAHGELAAHEFEEWLYFKHADLTGTLDTTLIIHLLGVNYDNAKAVGDARYLLQKNITEIAQECYCLTLKSLDQRGLGHTAEIESSHVRKKERTPWLHLTQCSKCDSWWYVATDTVDDDVYFQRLTEEQAQSVLESDIWPSTFDSRKAVWPPTEHNP